MNPDHGIISARPDVTWPISQHWEELTSWSVDEQLDMDLIATVAEHNGHPQWEERVLTFIFCCIVTNFWQV